MLRSGGRGQDSHDEMEESVPGRGREEGGLICEAPRRWVGARCRVVVVYKGASASSGTSSRPDDVSSCFEGLGEVMSVMEG